MPSSTWEVLSHTTAELARGAQHTACVVLGGGAQIGEKAFLGLSATVLPQIKVGARTVVGAGAVVTQDLRMM